tara:strand:- start:206 stop:697 length:492 start_codon:yes stop_codon:yes gene_type:complete
MADAIVTPDMARRLAIQQQLRAAPPEGPMLDGMPVGELFAGYADPTGLEMVSGPPMAQPSMNMTRADRMPEPVPPLMPAPAREVVRSQPAKIPMTMAPGMGVVYGQQAEAAERARPFMSLEQAARTIEMVEAQKERLRMMQERDAAMAMERAELEARMRALRR